MWSKAQRLGTAFLLAVCLGMPWTLLQSLAWVGMVGNYSQSVPFKQALSMTFDGKHPCKLCHFVQKGQAEEREQQQKQVKSDETLQLGLPPALMVFCHPPLPERPMLTELPPASHIERPSIPPPRA